MGAVTKFFIHLYIVMMVLFSILLPRWASEPIRLVIYGLCNAHKLFSRFRNCYLSLTEKRIHRLVYKKKLRPDLVECAICLSRFVEGDELRELPCSHVFHGECLDKWLQGDRATCPLCRRLVLSEARIPCCERCEGDRDGSNRSREEEVAAMILSAILGNGDGFLQQR